MPQYGIANTPMGDLTGYARRNAASGEANGNTAEQFSDFPDWMSKGPNLGGLDYLQANLNRYYNPKPMLRQTNQAANFMLDSSRAAASAAANAFAQRGMQSGGSSQGAGFAAASAMLPAFNQANMMRMDAQRMAAQMRSDAARTAAGIGSSIAGLYGQHLGTMSDYAARQQALQQAGMMQSRGYDLDYQRLGMARDAQDQGSNLQQLQLWLQNMNRLAPMGGYNVDNTGGYLSGDRSAMMNNQAFQQLRDSISTRLAG